MPFRPLSRMSAAVAAILATALPVSALSCLPPDPVDAFSRANAAEEIYVVVIGTFTGGPGPRPDGTTTGKERSYIAKFSGHNINRNGPFERIDRDVIVQETCAADRWCAELQTGTEMLTFLQVQKSGPPILTVGPCYGNVFPQPTKATRDTIRSCFVNGCTQS